MNINFEFRDKYPQYFNKLYEFQKTAMWVLPRQCFSNARFKMPEFEVMKNELNEIKGKLGSVDLVQWSYYTRTRDISGYVLNYIRKKINPELLTQAWCKFYEILNTFGIVKENDNEIFRTVHLCEAPGAFISALNHYLVLHYPDIQWEWIANSLNPYYEGNLISEMIPDDRLIRFTRKNWYFGLDLSGDIQQFCNYEDFTSRINEEEKVSLVTADGSIDCMSNPGEQERLVEFLQFSETITALAILKKGGSFVLKIFTIFEDSTICLLYLLNCIFAKVFVFKPCTSKSGNSELYVICYEYLGFELVTPLWNCLLQQLQKGEFNKTTSMFSIGEIPHCFRLQLLRCCSYFFIDRQAMTIKDNIYYFHNPDVFERTVLQKLRHGVAKYYIKRFKLKTIPGHKNLVSYLNVYEKKRKIDECESMSYLNKGVVTFNKELLNNFVELKHGRQIQKVQFSKFASFEFLENLYKYSRGHSTEDQCLHNLCQSYLQQHNVVINIKKYDVNICYQTQRKIFSAVNSALSSKKNIIFLNVPFHTQFMASLWCILATGFEEVHFAAGVTVFYIPNSDLSFVKSMFKSIKTLYCATEGSLSYPGDVVQVLMPEFFDLNVDIVEVLKKINTFVLPKIK
ncbi:cap-specific mRNA (nucleoside-2'-O-)-methyltransferase 2 [Cylas formicarius]|uniref:cap-specific mRNA (nucleoside-2'-O-)-methyltransferase 2 n=1 Tax=Cylas formicarius TaxID=197179 RepID=UPI0029583930|nr:cap-specific mRNA (nucleoside-2'-O-)-methyltransferase 2 [Cylas formicarius]